MPGALADVGLSVAGVFSPVPSGRWALQALKYSERGAEAASSVAKAADRAVGAATAAKGAASGAESALNAIKLATKGGPPAVPGRQ